MRLIYMLHHTLQPSLQNVTSKRTILVRLPHLLYRKRIYGDINGTQGPVVMFLSGAALPSNYSNHIYSRGTWTMDRSAAASPLYQPSTPYKDYGQLCKRKVLSMPPGSLYWSFRKGKPAGADKR